MQERSPGTLKTGNWLSLIELAAFSSSPSDLDANHGQKQLGRGNAPASKLLKAAAIQARSWPSSGLVMRLGSSRPVEWRFPLNCCSQFRCVSCGGVPQIPMPAAFIEQNSDR